MSRFKHLWLSFWRKDQGLGLIEAAVTLPLFLVIVFGLIEFGNMYVSNHQARSIADSVANYLKSNPSATASDLQTFVTALNFGNLQNTNAGQENAIFTKLQIKSVKEVFTTAYFSGLCTSPLYKASKEDWTNPWTNGEYKPYYIHVCYPYTYRFITPLSRLSNLNNTKVLKGKAVVAVYPIVTCPEGQFLNNNNGNPVCTQIDATCPNNQYMVGLNGNSPGCRTPSVNLGDPYSPGTSENDCTDAMNAVQVGMPDNDSVLCANLDVR